jgi:hypothetical protein
MVAPPIANVALLAPIRIELISRAAFCWRVVPGACTLSLTLLVRAKRALRAVFAHIGAVLRHFDCVVGRYRSRE